VPKLPTTTTQGYQRQVATPQGVPRTDVYEAPRVVDTSKGLQVAGRGLADAIEAESKRRDNQALLDYDQRLAEIDRRVKEGDEENPGALLRFGRNAAGVTNRAMSVWDKEATALAPRFLTAEAKERAAQARAVRREDTQGQLWAHEMGQGLKAADEAAESAKATYAADAVANADDSKQVEANLARLRSVVVDEAKRSGWDAATTAQRLGAEESRVLRGVFTSKLARDSVDAMEFFEANAGRFLGADRLEIEAKLQPYRLDVWARSAAPAGYRAAGGAPQGFEAIIAKVLRTEGGYVADDAGKGPTNLGINSAAHPGVDVAHLTPAQATVIYRRDYWDALGIDAMPPAMQSQALDAAVNQGPTWTRRALLEANGDPAAFAALRRARYEELAAADPTRYGKSLKGWLARVDAMTVAPQGDIPADPVAAVEAREAAGYAIADAQPTLEKREAYRERVHRLAEDDRQELQAHKAEIEASRVALRDRTHSVTAKLRDGIDVPLAERPTRGQLVAAFGEVEGGDAYVEQQSAAQIGPDIRRLAMATPEDGERLVASYAPKKDSAAYDREKQQHSAIAAAWASVLTQRAKDPMGFVMSKGLFGVAPINPAEPGNQWQLREAAAKRMHDTLGVPYRLLTVAEASAYSGRLASLTSEEKISLLSQTRDGLSNRGFQAVMGQVAATQPLTAAAGALLAVADESIDGRTGARVAATILAGQDLLAPNKGGPKVELAADTLLRAKFVTFVGHAYAGQPAAQEQAFQAFRAYYAARAGQLGKLGDSVLDAALANEAAVSVTGGVAKINDADTLLPWGVTSATFLRQAEGVWPRLREMAALPNSTPFERVTFTPAGGDRYYVMAGETPLKNATSGSPLLITIGRKGAAFGADLNESMATGYGF
jgi:hypothetical protein